MSENEILIMGTSAPVGIPSAEDLARNILQDIRPWSFDEVYQELSWTDHFHNLTAEEMFELATDVHAKIKEAKVIVRFGR